MSEREKRELANAHRGEVLVESAQAIEGRRLDQVVSLRLEPETVAELREIANRRGVTVSDLLREGAAMVILGNQQTMEVTRLALRVINEPSRTRMLEPAPSLNPMCSVEFQQAAA